MEQPGARLKKIRLEKGISLEEVHKKTKIHLNVLKAIEGESLTNLSPVYLKGFLKIYCKFLGVNPNEYIADYKEPKAEVSLRVSSKDIREERAGAVFTGFIKSLLNAFKALPRSVKRFFLLLLVFIILSVMLFNFGKFVSRKFKAGAKNKSAIQAVKRAEARKETAAQPQKAAAVPAKPAAQEVKAAPKEAAPSGIRLNIRTKENCWVSLKADGKVVFQRVLEKGRFESWQAKEKMELSLGNAGGVELEVNGQLFSNLGKRGQARKNILITKDGLVSSR